MRIQRLRKILPFLPALRRFYRSVHFLFILLALLLGMPAPSSAQPACPPDGDVDQNGAVTAADALFVFQQALGLAQLDACQRTIADVFPQPADPDGAITASDALCVFRKALGLPSCLDALPASNQPPVADAGADQSVDAGVMVFLSGSANDPDGAIASHAWTQTGGTTVSLTGFDAATAVFVAPDVSVDETLIFRLTVADDQGAQSNDEVMVTVHAVVAPPDQASAAEVFSQHISVPVMQTKCIKCHVANGASGHTRLVFVPASDTPDHQAQNLQTFQNFLAAVADEGGGSYVLNKIQGVGHGGGVQVSPGTVDFANMQRFLSLLGEELAPPDHVTAETLFDTVIMASPRKTLRRAALIFAGRIPTDEENAAVEAGDETALRATIRGLMEGPQFHEFLIRASNDRLLTDREYEIIDPDGYYVDFTHETYRRTVAVKGGDERARIDFDSWFRDVQYGVRRAPLELIAHVAENDLPYTEIMTADYIMANPWAAAAYGASTRFDDPSDPYEFKPSRIVSYFRHGDGYEAEYDPVLGWRVLNPGPLITFYPHAGVLNTEVFLQRYPSTATNRNRARARWTYYHFLGIDVEKSASRTTDPLALADTNNPTLHNPACTVCHRVLDPVAGAFQNYNDEGLYKSEWGGVDSLDGFYKYPEGKVFEIEADSWATRQAFSIKEWLDRDSHLVLRHLNNNWCDENECGTYGRDFRLDEIVVREVDTGASVHKVSWEVLDEHCMYDGQYNQGTGEDDHYQWWGWDCEHIPLELPGADTYVIEVVAWADRAGDELAKLAFGAMLYHGGDTWYRDMRTPGFAGATAPHPDNSLQWLARQIVANDLFAEAVVKFWWPAIMGSEVTEPPEDAADTDFAGLLLAANAQDAEVERLADGFRSGFQGGLAYNLKDLLVEIVLSKWFRADVVTDSHPVRLTALQFAGARRLLTPEELARKTAAVTGVQWIRQITRDPQQGRWPNALAQDYRLLYGGIDSDGITERARDITAVMAGVAKRHATEMSCPLVMRELYLLPDEERRLFSGIERYASPGLEISSSYEIEAGSRMEGETLALGGTLTAGPKTVRVTFLNRYWNEENRRGSNVYLDRLDVRDAAGEIIATREFENVKPRGHCGDPHLGDGYFVLDCTGSVEVLVDIPADESYTVEVLAWADHAGEALPRLRIAVESDADGPGIEADPIRRKLVELHDTLLNAQVTPGSPEVEAAYRLFISVMQNQREADRDHFPHCDWSVDHFLFEGILDDAVVERVNDNGDLWHVFDWERVDEFLEGIDFSDPHHTSRAWIVVLAAMMMDYRYLYL